MIAGAGWNETQARSPRKDPPQRVIHGPNYHPPYAAIVVDDKSGFVLHEISADEPRHPASLTKIMTLYLLFEQLEAGKLGLDTELPISTRAALQNPTKLGLKANQTIKVEDAIKGLVTKSANDAAVVVAEAIGGSEEEFAKLMTLESSCAGHDEHDLCQCLRLARRRANNDRPRPGRSGSCHSTPLSRLLPIFCNSELSL